MTSTLEALEPSIFEKSRTGAQGVTFSDAGVPESPIEMLIPGNLLRKTPPRLPEVSQLEAVRHFINLSHLNHCIDTGFYPLGSCTMKYNPKICDAYSLLEGLSALHPKTPEPLAQGALKIIYTLQEYLADITGFRQVSLQPAAGAQGELVGIMMIKAYFQKTGQYHRTEVIIPDSAHGTNPASAAMCGFKVIELKSGEDGLVDIEKLKVLLSDKTAACMLTNPNTAGLFEKDILEITRLVHEAGGLMYYDGANLNAVMGEAKPAQMGFDVMHINTHKTFATPHGGGGPGSGPVAVGEILEPFLPIPLVDFDGEKYCFVYDRPDSIGKIKAFYGNFEMMFRALTYILAYGSEGLSQVSRDAVLNANYLKERLKSVYHVAYPGLCKHEFVLTCKHQRVRDSHINTMAIVKRLMDFKIHPPTVYFPLIVNEAMMIEPTDTESKDTLDRFVDIMLRIAEECIESPDLILNAPLTTPIQRVDEVMAARQPDLNFYRSGVS